MSVTNRNFRCSDEDWEELKKTVEFYGYKTRSEIILHMIKNINRMRKEEEKSGRKKDKFDKLINKVEQ